MAWAATLYSAVHRQLIKPSLATAASPGGGGGGEVVYRNIDGQPSWLF